MGLTQAEGEVAGMIHSGTPFDAIEDQIQVMPGLVDAERSALWLYAWSRQTGVWQRNASAHLAVAHQSGLTEREIRPARTRKAPGGPLLSCLAVRRSGSADEAVRRCSISCSERSRIACQTFVVSRSGSPVGCPRSFISPRKDGRDLTGRRLGLWSRPAPGRRIMDVLVCPSCERRYAVGGAGSLGGWRCGGCNSELRVVNRDVSRLSSPRNAPPRPTTADDHLRLLGP